VVDLHRLGIDVRDEGVVGVGKGGQFVGHGGRVWVGWEERGV
jgi:hypothetical protein